MNICKSSVKLPDNFNVRISIDYTGFSLQLVFLSSLLSGGADAEIRLYDLGKNTAQLREPRITIRSKVTIPR